MDTKLLVTLLEDDVDAFYTQQQALLAVANQFITKQIRGGSKVGKKGNKNRNFQSGYVRIMDDYFNEPSTYNSVEFARRFRISRTRFLEIEETLVNKNEFFRQKQNAAKKTGISSKQKIISSLRQLAYGSPADSLDEYVRMSETTSLLSLQHFCDTITQCYSKRFLRTPTVNDLIRIECFNASRGFPGMIGSLDCTHWTWKNCPVAWSGQFSGKEKQCTVILEAVATADLRIWHSFFGIPGSCNDINVLDRSHIFATLLSGKNPKIEFEINGKSFFNGYYLADGIYPKYSALVKTISDPQGKKKKVCHNFFAFKLISNNYAIRISRKGRKVAERTLSVLLEFSRSNLGY